MKIYYKISTTVLATFVCGCVMFSSPPNNVGFTKIKSISDLNGLWKNQGEHGSESSVTLLSRVIWPKANINHQEIETIEVKAISEKELHVIALRSDGVEIESTFTEGENFDLENGRILLKREYGLFSDVYVGPYYQSIELGLDKNGQGKYNSDIALAGLAYLILPMVMVGSEDVRFVRVNRP